MREIILDTETTGLDPAAGHRVVEIGCVELYNHIPTGRTFHHYVDPERDVPAEAEAVHGLSTARLAGEPRFEAIAEAFAAFVGDAKLVAHNAPFDIGFLNAELERLGRPMLAFDRVVDTLALARRRHPGGPNGLDDLCRRYSIDNSRRGLHGALLDAELLAEVYIELIGGRQAHLTLVESAGTVAGGRAPGVRPRPEPLPARLDAADIAAHASFVAALGENALWRRYDPPESGSRAR